MTALAFAPDGAWLASGDLNGGVRLWDPVAGGDRGSPAQHTYGVVLAVDPHGCWVASSDEFGAEIRVWSPQTMRTLHVLVGHRRFATALATAPDGSWLAAAGHDGAIRLWDPTTGQLVRIVKGHIGDVRALAVAPDGSWLASAGGRGDCTVRLWDPLTGAAIAALRVASPLYHLYAGPFGLVAAGDRGPFLIAPSGIADI